MLRAIVSGAEAGEAGEWRLVLDVVEGRLRSGLRLLVRARGEDGVERWAGTSARSVSPADPPVGRFALKATLLRGLTPLLFGDVENPEVTGAGPVSRWARELAAVRDRDSAEAFRVCTPLADPEVRALLGDRDLETVLALRLTATARQPRR